MGGHPFILVNAVPLVTVRLRYLVNLNHIILGVHFPGLWRSITRRGVGFRVVNDPSKLIPGRAGKAQTLEARPGINGLSLHPLAAFQLYQDAVPIRDLIDHRDIAHRASCQGAQRRAAVAGFIQTGIDRHGFRSARHDFCHPHRQFGQRVIRGSRRQLFKDIWDAFIRQAFHRLGRAQCQAVIRVCRIQPRQTQWQIIERAVCFSGRCLPCASRKNSQQQSTNNKQQADFTRNRHRGIIPVPRGSAQSSTSSPLTDNLP